MIDYVKIELKNIDLHRLLSLSELKFYSQVSQQTGEIKESTKQIATYHYCNITLYESGYLEFTGSIHKLWNSLNGVKAPNYKSKPDKGFNGNNFSYLEIIAVKNHLCRLFDCRPNQMIFLNIEFGINTTPKFNPRKFLKGLLYHNGVSFEYKYKGNFAQVVHERYIVKVYNKSGQYGLKNHTLRFEIKIRKTIELGKTSIISFADINRKTLFRGFELLRQRFDELMYFDYTIRKEELSKREILLITNYSNPRYWMDELSSNHRDRQKKKLIQIINEKSENLKIEIDHDLLNKCVIINRFPCRVKCVTINSSSIELNITQRAMFQNYENSNNFILDNTRLNLTI